MYLNKSYETNGWVSVGMNKPFLTWKLWYSKRNMLTVARLYSLKNNRVNFIAIESNTSLINKYPFNWMLCESTHKKKKKINCNKKTQY